MSWHVTREMGVRYASPRNSASTALQYPILAERGADGSTLIVDKLGIEKSLPFWMEYRTLRVAPDGRVLYDSHAHGIQDGYGCLTPDGGIALLRVSKWEVLLLSREGLPIRTLSLAALAKQPPMLIAATDHESLLVAFVDRLFEVEIVEIGLDGRLLWYLPASGHRFGCPASLQRLPNGNLLIADEFCSTATEIDRNGAIVWQFGKDRDPAKRPDRLSNPHFVQRLPDGQRLIADTRNHRVLTVRDSRIAETIDPRETELCCPTSVTQLNNGHFLVCDAGNGRVLELDANRHVAWQFGDSTIERHWFSFPRSAECSGPETYLVADTANDRVVQVRDAEIRVWPTPGAAQLFWPRCARLTPAGSLLVADGRNSRVVELSVTGEVLNELGQLNLEGGLFLSDPHDVQLLPDGTLLLVDASLDLVAQVRWTGQVLWSAGRGIGPDLRDPHSAQRLDDGSILICDTGNSRILRLDRSGRVVDDRQMLRCGSVCYRFNRPRYAEITADGSWLIVDTGNNRILGADPQGESAWQLSHLPDSRIRWLNQPRWARLINSDELLVTDHLHHRVLHLRRAQASLLDKEGEQIRIQVIQE
jgi:NHL repeat-containing protein